jgi:hypothetical protein
METLIRTSFPEGPTKTRSTLYWRREPGAPSEDLGEAWVIERDGTKRPINGGDPISRAEAKRLARVGDHVLDAEPVASSAR